MSVLPGNAVILSLMWMMLSCFCDSRMLSDMAKKEHATSGLAVIGVHDLQVLELDSWDAVPRFPVARHLRHLILCSKHLHTLVGELQKLRCLETLSPQVCDTWLSPSNPCHAAVVNLAHLPNLKHLRYTDFMPAGTKMPEGCQLHFCINLHLLDALHYRIARLMGLKVSWLRFSWDHSFVHLRSLCLNFPLCFEEAELQGLRAALRRAPKLDFVRLNILHLGDSENGFDIFDVFAHVKQVVLTTTGRCWLSGCPSSGQVCKNLSVTCKDGLNIHLPNILGFMRGLCSFSLLCSRLSGVSPEVLVRAAATVGRRAVIENLPDEGACRVHTQCSLQQKQSFDQLMLCGCHTCAGCRRPKAAHE